MGEFRKLLEVQLKHNYYKDGFFPHVAISPTSECNRMIKNKRLIFKQSAIGFKILYRSTDEAGTPLIALHEMVLDFVLKAVNPSEFQNITKLNSTTVHFIKGKMPFLTNDDLVNPELTYHLLDMVKPKIFTYVLPFNADDPSTNLAAVEVKDQAGAVILSIAEIKPDALGMYRTRIDLGDFPDAKYVFASSDDTHGVQTQQVLVSEELAGQTLSGIIRIRYEAGTLKDYVAAFHRNETRWQYHLINKSGVSLSEFNLNIVDNSNDNGNDVYQKYTFSGSQIPDPANEIGGLDTLVLTSNELIPFYAKPKLGLQLMKTDTTGTSAEEVMIKNLPNPLLTSAVTEGGISKILVYV